MLAVNSETLKESFDLSSEILSDIELSKIPLTNIALKTCRLSRLLNDITMFNVFQREVSGYKSSPKGYNKEEWDLLVIAGRKYEEKVGEDIKEYGYGDSIEALEQRIITGKLALEQASDPDISISSANPNQYVMSNLGNKNERKSLQSSIENSTKRLSSRRSFIYKYALEKNIELKFSGINNDIFSRIRLFVDSHIGEIVPDIIQKFNAIYENLNSENSEDWSNAVHSCRRILQSLADNLYPPRDPIEIEKNGKTKKINLGPENYINRIIQYIETKNESESYRKIIGSQLNYFGERLDAIYESTNKGTHETITNKSEADRYVIYTYMILNDILSL